MFRLGIVELWIILRIIADLRHNWTKCAQSSNLRIIRLFHKRNFANSPPKTKLAWIFRQWANLSKFKEIVKFANFNRIFYLFETKQCQRIPSAPAWRSLYNINLVPSRLISNSWNKRTNTNFLEDAFITASGSSRRFHLQNTLPLCHTTHAGCLFTWAMRTTAPSDYIFSARYKRACLLTYLFMMMMMMMMMMKLPILPCAEKLESYIVYLFIYQRRIQDFGLGGGKLQLCPSLSFCAFVSPPIPPSHSLSLPFFPRCPLFSAFLLSPPVAHLSRAFPNPARGLGGALWAPPAGRGRAQLTNGFFLVHFDLKITLPDNTIDTYLHKFRVRTPAPPLVNPLLLTTDDCDCDTALFISLWVTTLVNNNITDHR